MACDCIEKMEAKLKAGHKGTEYPEARCRDLRIIKRGGVPQLRLAIFFEYKKRGYGRHKDWWDIPIFATHCPFCGKPFEEEKNSGK